MKAGDLPDSDTVKKSTPDRYSSNPNCRFCGGVTNLPLTFDFETVFARAVRRG